MRQKAAKIKQVDVPDPRKLSEHGASIDVEVPEDFAVADPWGPEVKRSEPDTDSGPEPGKPSEPDG